MKESRRKSAFGLHIAANASRQSGATMKWSLQEPRREIMSIVLRGTFG